MAMITVVMHRRQLCWCSGFEHLWEKLWGC